MKLVHWIDPGHHAVVCAQAWCERRPRGVLLLGVRKPEFVTCEECLEHVAAEAVSCEPTPAGSPRVNPQRSERQRAAHGGIARLGTGPHEDPR